MQVQYRLAWDRLDQMERGLGLRLVDRHAGGAGGGGACLTAAGRDLADRFNALAGKVDGCLAEHFLRLSATSDLIRHAVFWDLHATAFCV